jgi:hypothetical protein
MVGILNYGYNDKYKLGSGKLRMIIHSHKIHIAGLT